MDRTIGAEMNLSETAFVVPRAGEEDSFDLRWFTPEGIAKTQNLTLK